MEIGDVVYNLLWYEKHFQATERSFVLMVIYRSQQAIQIKGLGLFSCSLETFLAVRFYLRFLPKTTIIIELNGNKNVLLISDDSKRSFLLYDISSIIG